MKYLILFVVIAIPLNAQEFSGGEISGVGVNASPIRNGMVDAWDINIGVNQLGTNATIWSGIKGGTPYSTFMMYNTNMPTYFSIWDTNNFAVMSFQTNATQKVVIIQNDPIATLVSGANGGNPFAILCLVNIPGPAITGWTWAFGWNSASNVNASVYAYAPVRGASANNHQSIFGWNTNQAIAGGAQVSGGSTTNRHYWHMIGWSNGNSFAMNNLKASTATHPAYDITLNTFTLGGQVRSNSVNAVQVMGNVSMIITYTNSYFTPTGFPVPLSWFSNEMNYWNGTYRNGKYKVY